MKPPAPTARQLTRTPMKPPSPSSSTDADGARRDALLNRSRTGTCNGAYASRGGPLLSRMPSGSMLRAVDEVRIPTPEAMVRKRNERVSASSARPFEPSSRCSSPDYPETETTSSPPVLVSSSCMVSMNSSRLLGSTERIHCRANGRRRTTARELLVVDEIGPFDEPGERRVGQKRPSVGLHDAVIAPPSSINPKIDDEGPS